ncbi:hypothetical protein R1flu_021409 [Riccia fluitans]|uniref:Uncharacterized protein n=1 Tax=Riccia fluitans TaxID=41844 RepID=A0ABD1ZPA9_9MARC
MAQEERNNRRSGGGGESATQYSDRYFFTILRGSRELHHGELPLKEGEACYSNWTGREWNWWTFGLLSLTGKGLSLHVVSTGHRVVPVPADVLELQRLPSRLHYANQLVLLSR